MGNSPRVSNQEAGDRLGMRRRCADEPGRSPVPEGEGRLPTGSPFKSDPVFVSLACSFSTRPLLENEPGSGHSPALHINRSLKGAFEQDPSKAPRYQIKS